MQAAATMPVLQDDSAEVQVSAVLESAVAVLPAVAVERESVALVVARQEVLQAWMFVSPELVSA